MLKQQNNRFTFWFETTRRRAEPPMRGIEREGQRVSLTRGIKTGRTPMRARSPTRSTEGDKPEKAEKDSREREAEKAETPSLLHPVLFRHLPLSDASCGGLFKRRAFLLFYFRFHAGVVDLVAGVVVADSLWEKCWTRRRRWRGITREKRNRWVVV